MAPGRTLHVRCPTWEQVEQFHTRKLRRGKLLSMRVPFEATIGTELTLGLELPNGVTIAIDGTVHKASPIEGDTKTWIELELIGFTEEVLARIKAIAAEATAPSAVAPPPRPPRPASSSAPHAVAPPARKPSSDAAPAARADGTKRTVDLLPADERELFQQLTTELRRMRQAAVHEVLGVPRDAGPDAIRRAWKELIRRLHPDLVARRKAPAITHLAEELTILANRAYDRLRAAVVAEGRGLAVGSAVTRPPGWLVGFDDLSSTAREPAPPPRARTRSKVGSIPAVHVPGPARPTTPAQGGDTFETRARAMLGQGDADNAQEVLAAALVVYPRSRPLRSLYYVASAMAALGKGEVMLATSQLEAALAHYDGCTEAAQLLEYLSKHDPADQDALRSVFR